MKEKLKKFINGFNLAYYSYYKMGTSNNNSNYSLSTQNNFSFSNTFELKQKLLFEVKNKDYLISHENSTNNNINLDKLNSTIYFQSL